MAARPGCADFYCLKRATALVTTLLSMGAAVACWAAPSSAPPIRDSLWIPAFSEGLYRLDQTVAWPVAERKAYAELLAGEHSDWLLAPTQVQMQGFSVAERSAITALLAQDLADAGVAVPNTFLVERALGDGHRELRPDTIDAIAQGIGATNVILPYVGHDSAGRLTLTLTVYRKPSPKTPLTSQIPHWFTWSGIKYSDEIAPVTAVVTLRAEIIQSLGFSTIRTAEAPVASKPFAIPASPEALLVAERTAVPLDNAAALALLAVTAPPASRGADRLYERTLLAALRAPDSPQQRFLYAYALLRLGMRPNALQVLQGSLKSPALIALKAIVNGNLTGTETLVQHTSGYQRFILEFELHDMACWYRHGADKAPPAVLMELSAKSDWWATLIRARWNTYAGADIDSVSLKHLLDRHYPLAGQSLQDLIEGHAVTPGQSLTETDIQIGVLQHVRGALAHEQPRLCCMGLPGQANTLDLLSIIEAWSQWQVVRSIDHDLSTLGLPEQALQKANTLESVYAGLPEFEAELVRVEKALAEKSLDVARPAHLARAQEHAVAAMLEGGGQTPEGSAAMRLVYLDPLATKIAADYVQDFPYNPDWFGIDPAKDRQPDNMAALRRALAFTEFQAGYLDSMLTMGGDGLKSEVAAALRDRFLGNPVADNIRDNLAAETAGPDETLRILQARMRSAPDNWSHRMNLGEYLVIHGSYAEALQVFASFPGFDARSTADPIQLSNDAQIAGHLLYWHGAVPQARRLFGTAMGYHTGSEAEMVAAMETALIDGNLSEALTRSYERAERYPSASAYSNYLSLLHLTGHSEQAWKSFNLLIGQPLGSGLWGSAMVGLRIDGTTPTQLNQWLSQPQIRQSQSHGTPWQALLLLAWSATDRQASTDLVSQVRALAHEPLGIVEDRDGRIASYPSAEPDQRKLVLRSDFRAAQRPLLKGQSPVDSDAVPYSAGLLALQHGDFSGAVSQFDQVAAHFPIEHYVVDADATYALPDFAYASAKAGDPLNLEQFVDKLPEQIFESYLAQAYFQGIRHHDSAAAMLRLKNAFGLIDHKIDRIPSTEYQYADAAERLFKETGDTQFRDIAVRWAHTFQTLQPWAAWAYAMEAELTDNTAQRQAMLTKALFLDPLSPRLRAIPAEQLKQAKSRLGGGSPFVLPTKPREHPPGVKSAQTARPSGSPASG
jgi:hypothetical protein